MLLKSVTLVKLHVLFAHTPFIIDDRPPMGPKDPILRMTHTEPPSSSTLNISNPLTLHSQTDCVSVNAMQVR